MRNNLRFIFPRLIGATVIVGLVSFIMIMLFKLLVGILLVGGVIALVRRMAGRPAYRLHAGQHSAYVSGGITPSADRNQWTGPITVRANVSQQTIIPIN
ncbi:hypothetical protein DYBT9275_02798 [Dyadobacter sp. CECT 9275]|uniref:Uncharacterized protein n=1 Tax=Dyadobacter helix TaxID=2822344 RepID=A0A916NC29_9BACT|nr:hypothetical protein [Dyadobacter sp. CECT 9275]CAG5002063.1 hypothetical protein DYBT9275_02798 [Dyadobacter sp. CECT 9275]